MDCSICSPIATMPYVLRPPRNIICASCYEGARAIVNITNKLDNESDNDPVSASSSTKGLAHASKFLKEVKETGEGLHEKINYLTGFAAAFRDGMHTDIQVKPGNNEPPIPTHRALMASRSCIFRNILDSDECKSPANQTISLPELNHEELESLLEFLYSGDLPKEKAEKHVYSLSLAADKYDIPFLQKFCQQVMLRSLCTSNALDILEISDTCSNQTLKEIALEFIVRNMEGIVFSAAFDAFALKNSHLVVQITRASFMDIRSKGNNGI